MSYYIKTLFYAIPTFAFLILIEAIVAKIKGLKINRPADVISSLSSGITNTIRDAIKFTFAIVTYSWLVDNIAIYKLDSYWLVLWSQAQLGVTQISEKHHILCVAFGQVFCEHVARLILKMLIDHAK